MYAAAEAFLSRHVIDAHAFRPITPSPVTPALLAEQIEELRRLDRYSSTSSRPPSSDNPYKKKPRDRSLRARTGRKPCQAGTLPRWHRWPRHSLPPRARGHCNATRKPTAMNIKARAIKPPPPDTDRFPVSTVSKTTAATRTKVSPPAQARQGHGGWTSPFPRREARSCSLNSRPFGQPDRMRRTLRAKRPGNFTMARPQHGRTGGPSVPDRAGTPLGTGVRPEPRGSIEPGPSAWESDGPQPITPPNSRLHRPAVAMIDPSWPGLIARRSSVRRVRGSRRTTSSTTSPVLGHRRDR